MAREPFNYRWAQGVETQDASTTFQRPENTRLSSGWEGGADKDAPPAGQENWWHNRVDSALQGVERTGVMTYHPQAIYGLGAPTYGSDGNYYESTVIGNSNNDPVLNPNFWRLIGPSFFSGGDPGDVKAVAHTGVPSSGWIKCNGALLQRASYPRLFDRLGTYWNTGGESSTNFRVPDFRGEFLRGFDDGRGADPSRVFGSFQADELRSHHHGLTGVIASSAGSPQGNPATWSGEALWNTGPTGGSETRPRNKTVTYWIKY